MTYHDHLPVYRLTYSLIKEINKCTKKFSKDLKFTLGQQFLNCALTTMKFIIKANQATSKHAYIAEALLEAELMFTYLRLGLDFNVIKSGEFEALSIKLSNIIDQLIAWQKWDKTNN